MVTGLVDTSIVIDLIRQYAPALRWIQAQGQLGVTSFVWLEIIQGANNRSDEQKAVRLLNSFLLIDIENADGVWATHAMLRLHLSHNVAALDALIAASSYRLGLPLYTRNLKHFTPLLGTLAQKPYT